MASEIDVKSCEEIKKLIGDDKGLTRTVSDLNAILKKAGVAVKEPEALQVEKMLHVLRTKVSEVKTVVSKAEIEDRRRKQALDSLKKMDGILTRKLIDWKKEYAALSQRDKLKALFLGKKKVILATRAKAATKAMAMEKERIEKEKEQTALQSALNKAKQAKNAVEEAKLQAKLKKLLPELKKLEIATVHALGEIKEEDAELAKLTADLQKMEA